MSKVSLYFKWRKSKSKENIDVSPSRKYQRSQSLDPESLHKTGLREFILKKHGSSNSWTPQVQSAMIVYPWLVVRVVVRMPMLSLC
ncbi:unnamed protein product [Orchesella dallaii]|uniref:Uncharacterized protein n=1 Tax=Orchesella dallaii TaxID=48710 RepID=A0ABP1PSV8_9HEXA